MSGRFTMQLRYTAVLVALAMALSIPLATYLNAYHFPPYLEATPTITALVAFIVATPICLHTAGQITGLQTATASTIAPGSTSPSLASSLASSAIASRTAAVISASPPGFIIA